jgi:hypothetical protein
MVRARGSCQAIAMDWSYDHEQSRFLIYHSMLSLVEIPIFMASEKKNWKSWWCRVSRSVHAVMAGSTGEPGALILMLDSDLYYYLVGAQLIAFIVIAPYMSLSRWKPIFSSQIRPLSSTWSVIAYSSSPRRPLRAIRIVRYSAFVIMSAYTNAGYAVVIHCHHVW